MIRTIGSFAPQKGGRRMDRFTLSVVGRDRPGIVAEVSRVLFELGCNIEDSTCTILCGQFAMILVITHPGSPSVGEIDPAFDPVRTGMGLAISLNPLHDEGALPAGGLAGCPHIISVYGADRPGIVYSVARELARQRVNVTDLKTQVVGSRERPVYVMVLEVDLPDGVSVKDLEREFDRIRKELSVSISVRPIESVEL
jgi:glycine cleavage system transcriptional repressor